MRAKLRDLAERELAAGQGDGSAVPYMTKGGPAHQVDLPPQHTDERICGRYVVSPRLRKVYA